MSRVLAVAACVMLALFLGARALARTYVFPSWKVETAPLPSDARHVVIEASDGAPVHALAFDGPPGAPVVVHFHDSRQTVGHNADLGRAFVARGLGAWLVEYRGYGVAGGETTEDGVYQDAEAVLDHLARAGVPSQRVLLWGASLGTGVAAEMARRGRGAALVLLSPFTSIPDVVSDAAPVVPARLLVGESFDTRAKARDIRVPALVVHGDEDEVVPFWMGETLSRELPSAQLHRVPGGRHGDLLARDGTRILDAAAALLR
jgi:hypothetical protein